MSDDDGQKLTSMLSTYQSQSEKVIFFYEKKNALIVALNNKQ